MNNCITFYVDSSGKDYPGCPLRSDLNTCKAVKNSQINDCPLLDDEGEIWSLPDYCPLHKGGVHVRFTNKHKVKQQ